MSRSYARRRPSRRRRSRPIAWLRRLVWLVLLLVVITLLPVGWLYLQSRPQYSGTITVGKRINPIYITRDHDGVPAIQARSEQDAYFGLGYAHAQDRILQMEMYRRFGAGRLSEILGKSALRFDMLARGLRFYHRAGESEKLLSDELQAILHAYADGVNAWLEQRRELVPALRLLGLLREPWRPVDSLVISEIMAFNLSYGARDDLLRLMLQPQLEHHLIEQLFVSPTQSELTAYRNTGPSIVNPLASAKNPRAPASVDASLPRSVPFGPVERWLANMIGFSPWTGPDMAGASNGWVVDGSRSTSGAPLLASDPHLRFSAPILWYLARIEAPNFLRSGATLPGAPLHIIGHNGTIAWGITAAQADTQDVVIEEVVANPDTSQSDRYRTANGRERSFQMRTEQIPIRGAEQPNPVTFRSTHRGPVIPDALLGTTFRPSGNTVLTLAWTHLHAPNRTAQGLYRMGRARNWSEFLASLDDFTGPVQSVLYAGQDGIGQAVGGLLPRRRDGVGIDGPVEGGRINMPWQGLYPAHRKYAVFNPPQHRLLHANGRLPTETGRDRMLSMQWLESEARTRRIETLLDSAPQRLDASDMMAMQGDHRSNLAGWLVPVLLSEITKSGQVLPPNIADILKRMRQWDAAMAQDRPEPLIYQAWLREIGAYLFADEFGGHQRGREALARYWPAHAARLPWLIARYPAWCDDITSSEVENCGEQLAAALQSAWQKLSHQFGEDVSNWRWGAAHHAVFAFEALRGIPLIGSLTRLSRPMSGDASSINRGQISLNEETMQFDMVHGAGLRAVFDLSDLNQSRFMLATGQSGNPLSPLYDSFLNRWAENQAIALPRLPDPGGDTDSPWITVLR